MQVEMWHVFFEFSIMLESNYQFCWVGSFLSPYIQTDRSFQVIVATVVNQNQSLENMFYKIFYPLKVPFYPLPYWSFVVRSFGWIILEPCSGIAGAGGSRIFFIPINPMWTIFRPRGYTTTAQLANGNWCNSQLAEFGLIFYFSYFNGKWRFGETFNIWKMKWYFPIW